MPCLCIRLSAKWRMCRAEQNQATGRRKFRPLRRSLAELLASGARFCEQVMLLSALDDPEQAARLSCKRIGGPLLFGHLWERLGIADVLRERLAPRAFEFALERAVFVATLHRLFVSGSDRDCASWMQDYAIPGTESLSLHHFYRAMAW